MGEPLLRISPDSLPPPPSAPGWITLPEASRRSGWDDGYLRRRCGDEKRCRSGTWQARGLARLEAPPEGGRPRWLVHESAHEKLAPVKAVEQLSTAFDLRTLTAAQQAALLHRERCVLELERARGESVRDGNGLEAAIAATAARLDVSARTLRRWLKDYRTAGRACLVDGRWKTAGGRNSATPEDPFLQEVQRQYLDQRHVSHRLAYDLAVREAQANGAGWAVCSYVTAWRFLKRIPRRTAALYRGGQEAFAAAAPCHSRDYATIDCNDVWVGDHHRLDVFCRLPDGKFTRPWLTAWMDMRSRKVVGWRVYAHDPNADVILATFKAGVESSGAPWRVLIDNGKDFDAFVLQGLTKQQRQQRDPAKRVRDGGAFGRLGVTVMHAQPYRPQSKSIERFFGTVAGRFSPLFETYCGRDPADKPENLPEQLARGKAPAVEEVAAAFADWLDGEYHHKPHAGDGMDGRTPAEAFAAELRQKRVLPAELLEELTLERTRPLIVGRNGVRWQHVTYGRNEPRLIEREGKADRRVTLGIDHSNLATVRVYDAADGKFLCVAAANEKLPVLARDRQAVRDVVAQGRRDQKAAKAYHRARPRLAMSLTDRLHEAARQRRQAEAASPPDADPTLLPVQSPLADQLPLIRAALDAGALRPAVGAETPPAPSFREIGAFLEQRRAEEAAEAARGIDAFSVLARAMRKGRGKEEA